MAALGLQDALLEAVGGGGLGLADGGGGLEGDAEVDGGAVGDTALNAAGVVGLGGQALRADGVVAGASLDLGDGEGVVVDGAGDLAAAEARADLEALGGGNAEHGVRQLGLELVEAGLAQADGDVADHAGDGAADAVLVVPEGLNHFCHARCGLLVRAASGDEGVNSFTVDGLDELQELRVGRWRRVLGSRGEEVFVAHGGDKGDNFDTMRQA